MASRGIFISFEGSEGCGKTTQIQRLAESLKQRGRTVVVTREPGGTKVGEQIRHTLQHSEDSEKMTPEAELLLFAASRAQLVREVIKPALADGADVLADRFLDSTTVYQGVARRIPADRVASINAFAVDNCLPHLTFVLDLPAPDAMARLASRSGESAEPDRIEREPLEFYSRVRNGYLKLSAGDPTRIRLLDASRTPDSLAAEILAALDPLIS